MKDIRVLLDEKWQSTSIGAGGVCSDCETTHAGDDLVIADGGMDISTFMNALADKRRRYVLYYLQIEERAELGDVTEQVAVWETGTPSDELDEQTRRNVRISLYHSHLPKLEQAGIISYDHRHGSMRFQNPPKPVDRFLDYCSDVESPGISS